MKKESSIQLFSFIAIICAMIMAYFPPQVHSGEIWSIITMFLGYAIRDLFGITTESTEISKLYKIKKEAEANKKE